MENILKDISILSTIPEKYLKRLSSLAVYTINDAVNDAIINNNYCEDVDIGIGVITIWFKDNELKFKFKPSSELEKSLIDTIINKQNILENVLEESLVDKITNTYKDLL